MFLFLVWLKNWLKLNDNIESIINYIDNRINNFSEENIKTTQKKNFFIVNWIYEFLNIYEIEKQKNLKIFI